MSHHLSCQQVHRLFQVSEQGVVSRTDGYRAVPVHGGGNMFYPLSAQEALAACTPLPARLLISFRVQDKEDWKRSASAAAFVSGTLGLVAGMFAACFIMWLVDEPSVFALLVGVAIFIGMPVNAYLKEERATGQLWESSKWIDFTNRTWNERKHYTDGGDVDINYSVPLDSLALFCYLQGWEGPSTYDIGLCRLEDLEKADESGPYSLASLHSADWEDSAIDFGNRLATLWGIGCYYGSKDDTTTGMAA